MFDTGKISDLQYQVNCLSGEVTRLRSELNILQEQQSQMMKCLGLAYGFVNVTKTERVLKVYKVDPDD